MIDSLPELLGCSALVPVADPLCSGEDLFTTQRGSRNLILAIERPGNRGARALEGAFARGRERVRYLKSKRGQNLTQLAVVLLAPRPSAATIDKLRRFVEVGTEPSDWFVTDGFEVFASNRRELVGATDIPRRGDSPARSNNRPTGFSDRFLSCVKILTFAKLPARWRPDLGGLPAGREGWISSVRELADLSGVSLPQTRRFLATYEELGFLERGTQGIRLCRTLELLSSWSIQVASQFGQRVPARFNGTRESWLRSVRNRGAFDATNSSGGAPQSTRLVLGFHEAARLWELGEVVGAPISVYSTSPLKAVFDRLDLEPTSHESATVWLHRPRFSVSLRIGVSTNPKVDAPDQRIPVTDVVQCFIDLLHCPVRGAEAAERIRRDVFGEFD